MPMTEFMQGKVAGTITAGDLALFTESPTAEGAGVEVAGGSYARADVTLLQDPANSSLIETQQDAVYTNLPACDVVAVGLYENGTNDLLYYAVVDPAKHFDVGDNGTVVAGQFVIEMI